MASEKKTLMSAFNYFPLGGINWHQGGHGPRPNSVNATGEVGFRKCRGKAQHRYTSSRQQQLQSNTVLCGFNLKRIKYCFMYDAFECIFTEGPGRCGLNQMLVIQSTAPVTIKSNFLRKFHQSLSKQCLNVFKISRHYSSKERPKM